VSTVANFGAQHVGLEKIRSENRVTNSCSLITSGKSGKGLPSVRRTCLYAATDCPLPGGSWAVYFALKSPHYRSHGRGK